MFNRANNRIVDGANIPLSKNEGLTDESQPADQHDKLIPNMKKPPTAPSAKGPQYRM